MNKSKFNIRNYFNGKLFWEAFKQIRIVGLIFLVCLSAIAMFYPAILYTEYRDFGETIVQEMLLNIGSCMTPLSLLCFVATPIMFLVLFGFQTKRSGSDFYHSLPLKRSCQFITYVAAIFSWVLLITTAYTIVLTIAANVTSRYFVIDYSVIFYYAVNYLISSAIILGVFAIGTSLTGTLTSNIIMSAGILLIPRIIIMVLFDMIVDNAITLTYDSGFFIFNENCNIVFAHIFESFLFEENSGVLGSLNIFSLYSIILALIYLVIGLKLFITRPSEIANKSFRNKKIFALLKYGTGFIVSLFLVSEVYVCVISNNYDAISDNIIPYIVLVVAIGLSMFALEAAFTKSIKSGLKTALATPLILLLDLAFIFGASALTNHYNNEKIDKASVDYVNVAFDFHSYMDDGSEEYFSYFYGYYELQDTLDNTKITDTKIIDFLLDIYNSDRVKKVEKSYYGDYYNYRDIKVTFNTAFGEKSRYVYLTEMEFKNLGKMLCTDKNILSNFIDYPDSDSSAVICHQLSIEQSHSIYETYIKEISKLPEDKVITDLLGLYSGSSTIEVLDYLYVEFYRNGKACSYELPITLLTPETYLLYLNYTNEISKNDTLEILLKTEDANDSSEILVYADIYDVKLGEEANQHSYYRENTKANSLSSNFHILKNAIRTYYNNNKAFTYDDLKTGKYVIADVRIVYGAVNEYYYDEDAVLSTFFYVLLPTDSPLLDELVDKDILDGGYDIEVEDKTETNVEPESETNTATE